MTDLNFANEVTQLVYRCLIQEDKGRRQLEVLATDSGRDIKLLSQQIKALVTDFENPLAGQNSLYAKLLEVSFDEVDWQEIADTFLTKKY